MAPEQVRGERLDRRADVYAFGCLLFTALTGAPPFPRDSDYATMTAHLNDPAPIPSRVVPGIPASLDEVVAQAMAKSPGARAPSAGALMRWAAAQPAAPAPAAAAAPAPAAAGKPAAAVAGARATLLVADRSRAPQGGPDHGTPPTLLPPTSGPGVGRGRLIVVAAVVLGAALAVSAVLLLSGESEAERPFGERLADALEPLIDDNESVTRELDGLRAGGSPGGALDAVRDTLEGLDSTGDELSDLAPPGGEEATLRQAEELVGAERDYLDAVGSVLNNPGSPRIGELVRLEGQADDALGDLDPVAPGLESSLGGSEPLIAYSESRLSAREQREQQEAIASRQQEVQAGAEEQELEFTRQVDAVLEPSRPRLRRRRAGRP